MPVLLKIRFNKKQTESSKTKNGVFFSSFIESPIFNNNSYNLKLRMLHGGLKCKQLEEEIQSI